MDVSLGGIYFCFIYEYFKVWWRSLLRSLIFCENELLVKKWSSRRGRWLFPCILVMWWQPSKESFKISSVGILNASLFSEIPFKVKFTWIVLILCRVSIKISAYMLGVNLVVFTKSCYQCRVTFNYQILPEVQFQSTCWDEVANYSFSPEIVWNRQISWNFLKLDVNHMKGSWSHQFDSFEPTA